MTTIIKRCRGKNTRGIRALDEFRNKSMIPDSEIPKFQNLKSNQKQEKILRIRIPLNNILLRFMKLILIFMDIMKKIIS